MFTGRIPREIAKLYNLQFYLNLSWNLLDGSLPMEIGKIAMAQAIDISANQLTGVIPPTLGSCSELQSLNLSRNAFHGSIPESLGNLQSLMNLDLSFNSLSGTIPITLQKLKMLQFLNLSFNNLTGEIPKGGFFANQTTIMSFIGNPNLCGPHVFMLPTCPTPRDHFALVKKILFPMSGAIAFILCCLLLGFLWRGNIHIQNFDSSQAIFQKLEHKRISFQELHIATNGFTETNLLGSSSTGSVYKGILSDGTLVAVKVFQLQNDQGEKSFKAECSVLQKVRHRNLVRIITSCSNLHFKGLVFQFMPNGSLEKHLYPDRDENNGEDVCGLGLKTRVNIAIDVAHAMEYLHHYSYVQVVHSDIKPSNVLLDEDMTGHVTDFGLARLIGATSTDSLTSTLALRGSMGYIAPGMDFF
jgi:LRR receptor-like serine/threonine-protein kinase FLS2